MSVTSSLIRLDERPAFARRLPSVLYQSADFDLLGPHSALVSTYQLDSSQSSQSRSGSLCILEVDDAGNISLKKTIHKSAGVFRFEYFSIDRILSALTNGSLSLDDLKSKSIDVPVCDDMLLDVSSLDSTVLTCDNKGYAYIVDLDTETVVGNWLAHQLDFSNDNCEVWTCSLRNGNIGCTGAEDAKLKLWDARAKTMVGQCRLFEAGVTFADWRDDNQLLTGSYDEYIRLVDMRNLKEEVRKCKTAGGVWNVETSEDSEDKSHQLAACMYGGWLLLDEDWNVSAKDERAGETLLYGASLLAPNLILYVTFNDFTVHLDKF